MKKLTILILLGMVGCATEPKEFVPAPNQRIYLNYQANRDYWHQQKVERRLEEIRDELR